ncbi:aminotransferase class III-fold pyridoxal phosphate-dependent enzyme [Chitinophaga polysaccharea]|uniref:aminotransferase class III-fold pyridoxal phosphate-dependent enzyme n=1 Tax=Chitinophaga polysaccharea TaxID=1293035 RepID=UPI001455BE21|nr:aminotransferase class III-fold pyridoxal phosphate-dependent enzyme [Chitinophaga polysaccharea]NLR60309.1 aminotransferase class III-fold pyridoxal phosphate-dependent enzyme [Chitinophaga polysaccharea]
MEISVMKALVQQHYEMDVSVQALDGYEERNYLLKDSAGQQYICKVGNAGGNLSLLDAQIKTLEHLANSPAAAGFQRVKPNIHGQAITAIPAGYMRILTFLPGKIWVEAPAHTPALWNSLGGFLGRMDSALRDFAHPAAYRIDSWDLRNALAAREYLGAIKDHERRRMVAYFLLQFETEIVPQLSHLRMAVIHNDANDYNLLVNGEAVTGLIDFGDMVYSQLVNNVAVACTYAMLHQSNPLAAAAGVVAGYHKEWPLTPAEISCLYYLVAARLCISVTNSAKQAAAGSDNGFHFITEKGAWALLYQLIKINPLAAEDAFRVAAGLPSQINTSDDYKPLLEERKQHIGRNLSISYRQPLKIWKGALQYLYDEKGRTYIDCVNNVSHVGHCHPAVVAAIQRQAARLNTNTRYLYDDLVAYAKELTATLPGALKVCYFTNSGSEANDLAIRMSRHFTKQKDVIVLDHAYHGTSTVAMELSPYKFDGKGGFGKPPHTHKAVNPDLYRGEFRYGQEHAGAAYAEDVAHIITRLLAEGKGVAAFICETLLGVGGQIPLPTGYLEKVYQHVRAAGGICIADEVQVGFGRVGSCFWGFELQEVVPDIVVLGKPIGNGHPLAAVVTTPAIAEAFNNGMEYFNTFGGNPVSMATGRAVLKAIQEEEMQQHALNTGAHFLEGLKQLMHKHPIIGDVRGHGLFIGAELVRSRETLEPAVPEIDVVVEKMKDRGFLISTDGPLHNVLKIKPPLVFNKENADALLAHLDIVLGELSYPGN